MNPTNYTFREQAKAIVGAVLAGLAALGTALADGTISPVEWVGIAIALVATYGTVFGVSNGGTGQRNERGEVRITSSTWPVSTDSPNTRSGGMIGTMRDPYRKRERGDVSLIEILLLVLIVLVILAVLGVV